MKRKSAIIIVLSVLLCSFTLFGFTAAALSEAVLQLQKYDLNGDGNITIGDVAALLDYLANNCGHQSTPIPGRAPTCTEDGQEGGLYCPLCGAVFEEATPLFATGHSYNENGVCENCGDELYSRGLQFEYDEELGGYVLTDYGDCTDGDLVIPPSYDGFPVVAIDSSAFTRCTDLVSVTIPGSVKTIGDGAFSRCTALEKVVIGSGVEKIGNSAFSKCTALTEISIPKSVETMGEGVFDGCTALLRISLNVEEIPALWHEDWKKGCDATVSMLYDNEWLEWLTTEDLGQSYTRLNWGLYLVNYDSEQNMTASAWETWPFYNDYSTGDNSKFHLVVSDWDRSVDLWTDIGTDAYPYVWKTFYRLSDSEDDYKSVTGNPWSTFPFGSRMLYRYNLMDYGMEAPLIGQSYHMIFCIFDTDDNLVCWSDLTVEWTDSSEAYYQDALRLGFVTLTPCVECQWQDATCETPKTCRRCRKTEGAALGHSWQDADCDTPKTCLTCGKTEGAALGHDWQDATCEAPKTCLNCGKTEGEALGHDWQDGICSRCGCDYYSEKLVYTLSDDKSFYTVTGIGDCTDTAIIIPAIYRGKPVKAIGNQAFNNCTFIESVTIPDSVKTIGSYAFSRCSALANITLGKGVTSIQDWAFYSCKNLKNVVVPDGVTSMGIGAFGYCSALTDIWCEAESKPTDWNSSWNYSCSATVHWGGSWCYVDGVPTLHDWQDATCEAPKSCLNCGKTEGEALGHDWQDATCSTPKTCLTCGKTEGEALGHDWQDATCEAPKTCLNCGKTEGGALNHDWQDATCLTPKSCLICGKTEGEALGHDWIAATCLTPKTCAVCGKTQGRAHGHDWQDATCEMPATCIDCGETEGEALGHNLINGACSRCDYVYVSEGLAYTLSDDESYYIVSGIGNCADTHVMIPSTYKSKPVKSIGDRAFYYCSKLTSIIIPDSVTSIGNEAFFYCSKLTSITIPSSVTSIGSYAFANCSELTSVTIPDSVTSIKDHAFFDCTRITSVTLGKNVTYIDDYVFSGCSSLTSIVLPDGVTSIGKQAFDWCSKLTSITIPGSVTSIGDQAFFNCYRLTSIIIPDSVTYIDAWAFYGCDELTDIWCEATAQPAGWNADWKYNCSATVHWGGK